MHQLDLNFSSSLRCQCGATLFLSPKGRLVTAIDAQTPSFDETDLDPTGNDDASSELVVDIDEVDADENVPESPLTSDEREKEPESKYPIIVQTEEKPQQTDRDSGNDRQHRAKNRNNRTPMIAGFSLVSLLLGASLVMFLTRSPDNAATKPSATQSRTTRQLQTSGEPSPQTIAIAPGTLKALAAKIPTPNQNDTSEQLTSLASTNGSRSRSPNTTNTKDERNRSPFGGPTVAPDLVLPRPSEPRERIAIIAPARTSRYFDDAYNQAYQKYDSWSELDEKTADRDEYKTQFGQTLGAIKAAYEMSLRRDDRQRREELLYLLTYLSQKAGRLMEAAIYGELIARTGDASASATRDGASIALAALQEATAIHWGKPDDVGELRYMQSIAEVIDARWPDDSQHNEIWFTLAQTYAAFGQYEHATGAYAKVRKESSLYADAKLGSGTAYWSLFLRRASQPDVDPDAMLALLSKASAQYNAVVKVLEPKLRSPTLPLLTAKQMLAIIADRTGDSNAVIRWTTTGKFPLVQPSPKAPPRRKGKRKRTPPQTSSTPPAFARTALQLLYRAQTQQGDLQAAQKTLAQLDKLPNSTGNDNLKSMQLATAVRRFKQMTAKERIVMPEIKELDALLAKLPAKSNAVSPQDWLWIGQAWADLAPKATNAQTSMACYDRAAKTCSLAIALPSFPEDRVAATQVRHAEWLRRAGKTQASFDVLAEILEKSPNVFDLQTQAAMSLEKLAIEQDSEPDLRTAIRGPEDQPAIWGWSKLAVQLHKLRYSDCGTVEHADALLAAHFHLARCRWMLVEVLDGGSQQDTLRRQTHKQIASARLAIPEDTNLDAKWSKAFDLLESELSTNQ